MCGISDVTHALGNIVTGTLTLGTNLAVNALRPAPVPNIDTPSAPSAPPARPEQAPQAAQRPQNSAGSIAPGSSASTLITGGQGIAPSLLTLGRNTLLGQ